MCWVLGYINTTPTDKDFNIYENEKGIIIGDKIYTILEVMSMKFHSDWNWIMELVEAIEVMEGQEAIKEISNIVLERNLGRVLDLPIYTKKEKMVQAINQFLIWYCQQPIE